MSRHIVFCVVLGGCGFHGAAAVVSDGPIGDVASDGAGSDSIDGSMGTIDCFQNWLDHTVAISDTTVREITELSSAGNDRNPWISADGRRMYFSRDQGTANSSDIYVASRGSTAQPFALPAPVVAVNSVAREGRAWLTPDELTVAVSTNRNGQLDIEMTTRVAGLPFGMPVATHLTMVNSAGSERADPFLSSNRQRLYLAIDSNQSGGMQLLQLLVATRASTSDDFSAPMPVPGMFDRSANQADPSLYRDERLLLFSGFQSGESGDLWYATRPSAADSFGAPIAIPGVNTDANEFDAVLSADGCELYFASTRRDDKFHLFHAQVAK